MTNIVNFPNSKPQHYNVLWSSGLDSTYLVYILLEQGHYVNALYFEVKNNSEKVKHEMRQREKIAGFFKEKYGYRFNCSTKENVYLSVNGVGDVKLGQAIAWIAGSILTLKNECQYMAIGYVKGDDAIDSLQDIKDAFYSLRKLSYSNAELVFPLQNIDKKTIYENIPDEIKDEIYWCENGRTIPSVCPCAPCKKARAYNILSKYQYSGEPEVYLKLKEIENMIKRDIRIAAE